MTVMTVPRSVCRDHSRYVAGCADCREQAAMLGRVRNRLTAYGQWGGLVDAGPAVAHLKVLVAAGFTPHAAAKVAGVGKTVVERLVAGSQPQAHADTVRKILAVEPVPPLSAYVSSLGASRRLQALMAAGWDAHSLAPLLGTSVNQVRRWRWRAMDRIQYANHLRIAEVFRRIGDRSGPSDMARGQARHAGYAPPICWDDDGDIDNPKCGPKGFKALTFVAGLHQSKERVA